MDVKATIYLSIIFASWVIGSFVPINTLLGAPLSLVTLAYFQPYLKQKITTLVFALLTIGSIILSISVITALFTVANNIYSALGIPYWCIWIILSGAIVGARLLVMYTAENVIKKSKIRSRYPLCS